jgi:transposase-like protein
MISSKGRHNQQEAILQCVRWCVAYPLSYRDFEELMQERGYLVDHSTIQLKKKIKARVHCRRGTSFVPWMLQDNCA